MHATASAGTFNLDVDANGRWSVEKFKGLLFQIERESNVMQKNQEEVKETLSYVLLMLHLLFQWQVY